jgi:hypothetical protein
MKETYIKDKFLRDIAVYEFPSPIAAEVILSKHNFYTHIVVNHPEMTIDIIKELIETPSRIYEVDKKEKLYYYEKTVGGRTFLAAVGEKVDAEYLRIITAFMLTDYDKNRFNRVYCIYDENITETSEDDLIKELEQEDDYFYNLFNSEE